MAELEQMNLSVDKGLAAAVKRLATPKRCSGRSWSKREVVTRGVEALAELMERHRATAAGAADKDVGRLFLRVAEEMPAGLTDEKVEYGHFTNGNPFLILKGWYVAEDPAGDLMTIRPDGSEAGHISHGRIEKLADLNVEGEVESLKTPEEVVLT